MQQNCIKISIYQIEHVLILQFTHLLFMIHWKIKKVILFQSQYEGVHVYVNNVSVTFGLSTLRVVCQLTRQQTCFHSAHTKSNESLMFRTGFKHN